MKKLTRFALLAAGAAGLAGTAHGQTVGNDGGGVIPWPQSVPTLLADEPGTPPPRVRRAPPPEQPPPPPPVSQPAPPPYQPPPPPPFHRWYAMVSAAALIPKTTPLEAGGFIGQIDWGVGFNAFLGVGYRVHDYVSVEIEGGYVHLPIDGVQVGPVAASVDGTSHNLALFGNLVLKWWPYWTAIPPWARISPYAGAGIGFVHQFDSDFTATIGGTTVSGSTGNRTELAAQVKAGVDFEINERWSLGPEYRFIWINANDGIGHTFIHAVGATLKFAF